MAWKKAKQTVLLWSNHCTFWANSWWTTNDWKSDYFVKLVRWKNKNPNTSNMRWLDFELKKKREIWLSENLPSSLSWLHLTNFSSDWEKKGRTKDIYIYIYIYKLKKLISLVYNINYLIAPIDRAPQRLYSRRYSYTWRNNCDLHKHH